MASALKLEDHDLFETHQLPDLVESDALESLELDLTRILATPTPNYILDFSQVNRASQKAIVILMGFIKKAKQADKKSFSINMNKVIEGEFREKGIFESFNRVGSAKEIIEKIGSSSPPPAKAKKLTVDAEVLGEFIGGTSRVFEVQMGIDIVAGKVTAEKFQYEDSDDIIAIASIKAPGLQGSISLCMSEELFCNVYQAMLDEEIDKIDDDSKDAASEILNMIYGHVKTSLNKLKNLNLPPVIPVVELKPKRMATTTAVIKVPFTSEAGDFRIEILVG